MPVFAAECEGESRGIGKPNGRAVHDFCDDRQRLQRARSQLFEQQKFGKIVQLSIVRDSEHAAEPLQIHIRRVDFMARGKTESCCLLQCDEGLFGAISSSAAWAGFASRSTRFMISP